MNSEMFAYTGTIKWFCLSMTRIKVIILREQQNLYSKERDSHKDQRELIFCCSRDRRKESGNRIELLANRNRQATYAQAFVEQSKLTALVDPENGYLLAVWAEFRLQAQPVGNSASKLT